jgi:hypothetical protein
MGTDNKADNGKATGLPTEFKFEESLVRTVLKDGEPWFTAKDVCEVLGLENPSKALEKLDQDEKGITNMDTPGGSQQMLGNWPRPNSRVTRGHLGQSMGSRTSMSSSKRP